MTKPTGLLTVVVARLRDSLSCCTLTPPKWLLSTIPALARATPSPTTTRCSRPRLRSDLTPRCRWLKPTCRGRSGGAEA